MDLRPTFVTVAVLIVSASEAHSRSPAANQLDGLWAFEANFGPSLRDEVTVTSVGRRWRASAGTLDVPAALDGRNLRFAFEKFGGFRGRISPDGKVIEGFWLQPSGVTDNRPEAAGSAQPFATPMALRRKSAHVWRGTVVPLNDRFTLYLSMFRNQKGDLVGAFRNPELNSNGGASRFLVKRLGDKLRFEMKNGNREVSRDATYFSSPERINIKWQQFQRAIELTRRDPGLAAGFFPRLPGSPPYKYRRPPETGDGWRTAAAGGLGINEQTLADAVRGVIDSDPTKQPPTLMHSMLVAYRGRLVLEEYFFGYGRDTPHDMRSAGKTFSSVMLGAAMSQGLPLTPESRIADVLGALGPFANPDPRKGKITLAQLMTHSAGLACNDNDDGSPGNEGTMSQQTAQPNWWKYTLDLPMAHDPGDRYAYCSANINLVGGALTVGTSTWLPEYFERTVARPLQFGRWHWNLMPSGEGYLGGGAFVRPRDLLKVGQTYLDGGIWNGRRIVDESWIKESTRPRIAISPATTGYSAEEFGDYYTAGNDGLAWHSLPVTVAGRPIRGYAATGNGGQILLVIPEYQLAVVFTGGNYLQGGVWGRWGQQIVGDQIIPAIARQRSRPKR